MTKLQKLVWLAISVILAVGILLLAHNTTTMDPLETYSQELTLTSSAFTHGAKIPAKYTCDGENVSPPLSIAHVPAGTKSFTLIVDDPDIPDSVKQSMGVEVFDHWVYFNIPADVTEIVEGAAPVGVSGAGTRGEKQYLGPCPPDRAHRYYFKLYALDTDLAIPEGSTKVVVEAAMAGHILGHTELVGIYERLNH